MLTRATSCRSCFVIWTGLVRRKHLLNERAIQPAALKTGVLLIDANGPESQQDYLGTLPV